MKYPSRVELSPLLQSSLPPRFYRLLGFRAFEFQQVVLYFGEKCTHVELGGDTVSGRTGQRVSSEGAGVVARLEHICPLLAKHRTDRHTSAKRLKKRADGTGCDE